jgi:Protein of unknown function (DUF3300)
VGEITFGKPRGRKKTSGEEEASLKIRRLAGRMNHDVGKTTPSVGSFRCSRLPPPVIQPVQVTAKQLQQLVAPIALYPDELVAEILTASTYPTQIVEADRWLQENSSLRGAQLADEVDKQSWDPSVKATCLAG